MNKVESVNLNGRAYQIEERGYEALDNYLKLAEKRLKSNPDKNEILVDFEQALAEKCDQVLTGGKTVVSQAEIDQIIEQMGPVDDDGAAAPDTNEDRPAKRLYLIKEGAIIGGVCGGIANYFNIDVTVVRLIALLLAFFTSGTAIIVYIVLMILIPVARTPEEKAAAQGYSFNSRTILDSARQKYEALGTKQHWQTLASGSRPLFSGLGGIILKTLRIGAAAIAVIGTVLLLGIIVVGISSIWSLLFSSALFGFITFSPSSSMAMITLLVVCGLLVGAIPIFLVTIICFQYAKSGLINQNIWAIVAALVLFAVALGLGIGLISANSQIRKATLYHKSASDTSLEKICLGDCPPDKYPVDTGRNLDKPLDSPPQVLTLPSPASP